MDGEDLGARVDRLEAALVVADALGELGALGDPTGLATLFEVEARRLVRLGPDFAALLRRLIQVAGEAAGEGLVAVELPVRLRDLLTRLAARLREAGAWVPTVPLWWEPLPPPVPAEALWRDLEALLEAPVLGTASEHLAASFGDTELAPRRRIFPELLPPEWVNLLHGELEAALAGNAGWLEPGTVGARGSRSGARTDAVRYVTGLEPHLLASALRLAVLVQWSLRRLAPHLGRGIGVESHAPQRVMIARYPAPSRGFAPHFDNPGGGDDNGRLLSLVLYLNAPASPCRGGELALWGPEAGPGEAPAVILAPWGGSLAVFDARRVLHEVRPLEPGPARWSLALWMNEHDVSAAAPVLPEPSLAELLLPVEAPPLARGVFLLHELREDAPGGVFHVRRAGKPAPRVGIVTTTDPSTPGAASWLAFWCRHHLGLGAAHLVLIFDPPSDEAGAATEEALRHLLRRTHPPECLTLWSGARLAGERWSVAGGKPGACNLLGPALSGRRSSQAVAARQTLNASAALVAARAGELTAGRLDWLLHLDDDELWTPIGTGRGGTTPAEHLAAAAEMGHPLVHYANHELLLPVGPEGPRFKINPELARHRLGTLGWERMCGQLAMGPEARRPYFHGYVNGKSAVAVEAAEMAAGVHGWRLEEARREAVLRLAGPVVLHLRYPTADHFAVRYLAKAADEDAGDRDLFLAGATEERAVARLREGRRAGRDEEELRRELAELYREVTHFSPAETELLAEAGLLVPGPPSLAAAWQAVTAGRAMGV